MNLRALASLSALLPACAQPALDGRPSSATDDDTAAFESEEESATEVGFHADSTSLPGAHAPEARPPGDEDEAGSDSPTQAATIAVRLTDAPGDYEAVPVTIARIEASCIALEEALDSDEPEAEEEESEAPPTEGSTPEEGDAEEGEPEEPEEEPEQPETEEEADSSWVTLVDEPQSYDLLTLQDGVSAALGEALLEPGSCDQIRLIVSEAAVVVDGETHALTIPSGEQTGFKLSYDYTVEAGGAYELLLDFDAHESIRQTGNGRYMLQPVITVAYFGAPQEHPEDADGDIDEEVEEDIDEEVEEDIDDSFDTGL